ncbi:MULTISPECIES: OmpH family outer membrane protein [unclassified Leeuwenhoekiella]|uniref:OmpH family outer membrane protein n=1 Tax=unclassified Leeuwenhoekiella TaxID=2615029 RepID=UPI000C674C95|nr:MULTISPECIES: OmpH family outer membrane protein [unclassified Leeuwenhoekiella]MAW95998.1 hypothetical protein [Leeuwenhoekiella sp.]MBA79992.1 hypothetical protein [Leeuwenhoekiella sp.]|tara:strand:+ start:6006 stop:6578 length:573 start_codon:yes stop_codon:yes gene_type:complete
MKISIQLVLLAFLVSACSKSKTGFVDTQKLFEEYTELTEVQDKYTKMSDEVRADLEPQIQAFQIKVDLYQKNAGSMSPAERQQKEQELGAMQQQIQQAQQMRGGQIQQESQAEIDTIIKKVRDFIADYGKKNEYEYIYGKNEGANILYGKEELDLTDEILKALNDKYSNGDTVVSEETETEAKTDTTVTE